MPLPPITRPVGRLARLLLFLKKPHWGWRSEEDSTFSPLFSVRLFCSLLQWKCLIRALMSLLASFCGGRSQDWKTALKPGQGRERREVRKEQGNLFLVPSL